MNLPGSSEPGGEMETVGIIPVLVFGFLCLSLRRWVHGAEAKVSNRFPQGGGLQLKHVPSLEGIEFEEKEMLLLRGKL